MLNHTCGGQNIDSLMKGFISTMWMSGLELKTCTLVAGSFSCGINLEGFKNCLSFL